MSRNLSTETYSSLVSSLCEFLMWLLDAVVFMQLQFSTSLCSAVSVSEVTYFQLRPFRCFAFSESGFDVFDKWDFENTDVLLAV